VHHPRRRPSGRRNTLIRRCWSGTSAKLGHSGDWKAGDAVARAAPVANREHRLRFWEQIAAGATSEDAGVGAGVSPAVGTRWFREAGGMPPSGLKPHSGRYLTFVEREEIAICRAYGFGIREIARHLGRSASTISRELRRNAATRGGTLHYRAVVAQWKAERQTCRPKVGKLAANDRLREYVRETGCPVR
jgi:hypothetical protein